MVNYNLEYVSQYSFISIDTFMFLIKVNRSTGAIASYKNNLLRSRLNAVFANIETV